MMLEIESKKYWNMYCKITTDEREIETVGDQRKDRDHEQAKRVEKFMACSYQHQMFGDFHSFYSISYFGLSVVKRGGTKLRANSTSNWRGYPQ